MGKQPLSYPSFSLVSVPSIFPCQRFCDFREDQQRVFERGECKDRRDAGKASSSCCCLVSFPI